MPENWGLAFRVIAIGCATFSVTGLVVVLTRRLFHQRLRRARVGWDVKRPKYAEAGLEAYNKGNFREAEHQFHEMLRWLQFYGHDPEGEMRTWTRLSMVALKQGELREAGRCIDRATQLMRDNPGAECSALVFEQARLVSEASEAGSSPSAG